MGETQAASEGLQFLSLRGKLAPSEGKYLQETSRLDVVAFARNSLLLTRKGNTTS
jgi:hypothetical protein